ncbi:MAG: hypothetical protein GF364_05145 [Candidatus Lokiarchaeota archaeon]|nr:hypothetical protein [Candidatus Lokiarchaeota archaeon]
MTPEILSNIDSLLGILNEINLKDNDIDKIYSIFLTALRNLPEEKRILLRDKIEEISKDKENLEVDEIGHKIRNKLTPEILNQLQDVIIDNFDLKNTIQDIFYERLIE